MGIYWLAKFLKQGCTALCVWHSYSVYNVFFILVGISFSNLKYNILNVLSDGILNASLLVLTMQFDTR